MAKKADVPEFGMLRGVKVVHASTVVAGPIAGLPYGRDGCRCHMDREHKIP